MTAFDVAGYSAVTEIILNALPFLKDTILFFADSYNPIPSVKSLVCVACYESSPLGEAVRR